MAEEKKMKNVDVVVPTFNESKNIREVLDGLLKYFEKNNIIVVDDGSKDNTSEIAKNLGVRLIKSRKNFGKGHAIRTGINASENKYILLIDADGQHYVTDALRVAEEVQKGYDIVLASRFLNKTKIPIIRRWGNYIIRGVLSLRFKNITDPLCGLRAFKKASMPPLSTDDFCIDIEIIAKSLKKRVKFKELPISIKYKKNDSSKFSKPLPAIFNYIKLLLYSLKMVFW